MQKLHQKLHMNCFFSALKNKLQLTLIYMKYTLNIRHHPAHSFLVLLMNGLLLHKDNEWEAAAPPISPKQGVFTLKDYSKLNNSRISAKEREAV